MEKKKKRFEVKDEQSLGFDAVQVIVDTETGVNYLHVLGHGGGIIPLLDENGKIIVDK